MSKLASSKSISESDDESEDKAMNVSNLMIRLQERNVNGIARRTEIRTKHDKEGYKRRLGDLVFDANYEGGNLGYVEAVDRCEYDLMLRPDVASVHCRAWFNFTVKNYYSGQVGLTPVARCSSKPNWKRLNKDQTFYYKSSYHGDRFVLSFAFKFGLTSGDLYQFSLLYPYTYTSLTSFIDRWITELKRQKQLGKKSLGQIDLKVDIKNKNNNKVRNKRKSKPNEVEFGADVVVESALKNKIYLLSLGKTINRTDNDNFLHIILLCGTASGNLQSPCSYVGLGFVDFMLSSSTSQDIVSLAANSLLNAKVYPLIDPDSTKCGNTKTGILGEHQKALFWLSNKELDSLNASKLCYSLMKTRESFIEQVNLVGDTRKLVVLELVTNFELIGARLIGCHYKDLKRMEEHVSFARSMCLFSETFYLELSLFRSASVLCNRKPLLEWLLTKNNVNYYQLELSPLGYYERTLLSTRLCEFTQQNYISLGKTLVYSCVNFARQILFCQANNKKNTNATKKYCLLSKQIPESICLKLEEHLKQFKPNSSDIDDLLLRESVKLPAQASTSYTNTKA